MRIITMKVDNNDDDLTFSHNKETKKQDHGVTNGDDNDDYDNDHDDNDDNDKDHDDNYHDES